jgi:ATP-dependent Clp protease ATP-binding subunit ClpC
MPLKYPYLESDTNEFIKDAEALALNTFKASALIGDHILLQGFMSGVFPFDNLITTFSINPDLLLDKYIKTTGIGRGVNRGTIAIDNTLRGVLNECSQIHQRNGILVGTATLVYIIFHKLYQQKKSTLLRIILDSKLDIEKFIEVLKDHAFDQYQGVAYAGGGSSKDLSKDEIFNLVTEDLTKKAKEGNLDPVIGREKETQRIIEILCRKGKNNPVLIGPAGVGKTAICEGLAQRIIAQDVPNELKGSKLISLNVSSLLSGTKFRGDFEKRLKHIIEVAKKDSSIIIYIDEIHTILGAGAHEGGMDLSNMLKPALARGEIKCIGSTTLDEYRIIEKDPALERRFNPIKVEEPTEEAAIEMLKGIRKKFEHHHKMLITDDAIEAAVILSAKYVGDRFLPDKAIDLIDEAGSKKNIERIAVLKSVDSDLLKEYKIKQGELNQAIAISDIDKAIEINNLVSQILTEVKDIELINTVETLKGFKIDKCDIEKLVESITGIPVQSISNTTEGEIQEAFDKVKANVIGQKEAIKALELSYRNSRAKMRKENKPQGSFLFIGPSGTGKTYVTKSLAKYVYGVNDVIRLDMSEFQSKHDLSKIIGSPPGFVGYEEESPFLEKIRHNPYSVILLDEVEKAHPDIFNLFLQVLDEGFLTSARDKKINFRNTTIIMTSNLGASAIQNGGASLGFSSDKDNYEGIKSKVMDAIKDFFRPEFINRIDDIIVFKPLELPDLVQISDLYKQELIELINTKYGIKLNISTQVLEFIIKNCINPAYGARPLRRGFTNYIEDLLAEYLLNNVIAKSNNIKVINIELKDNTIVIV